LSRVGITLHIYFRLVLTYLRVHLLVTATDACELAAVQFSLNLIGFIGPIKIVRLLLVRERRLGTVSIQ
jgi:hypothetical protein